MLLPFLSALLGIIAFLPFNLYPLSFFWLVPLFIFFRREQKLWRLILGAAVFRLVLGLGTVYYTLEPIFWSSSLLIFLGLPIVIWGVKKIVNYSELRNSYFCRPESKKCHPELVSGSLKIEEKEILKQVQYDKYKTYLSLITYHLSLIFFFTFFDLLQTRFSLLPTYIITAGNMLGSSPFVGLAAFGGMATLTFFAATINALIAGTILHLTPSFVKERRDGFPPPFLKGGWEGFNVPVPILSDVESRPLRTSPLRSTHRQLRERDVRSTRWQLRQRVVKSPLIPLYKGGRKFFLLPLALLLSAFFLSQYLLRQNTLAYAALPNSLKIVAVSTNDKFTFKQFPELKTELLNQRPDLLIFPEDIFSSRTVPFDGQTDFFKALSQELDAAILATFDTFADNKKYNSAVLFDSNGQVAGGHNKNRLTFIGETWPFGNWRPSFYDWLAQSNPKIKNYAVFDQRNAYGRGNDNGVLALARDLSPTKVGTPRIPSSPHTCPACNRRGEEGLRWGNDLFSKSTPHPTLSSSEERGQNKNTLLFAAPICLEIQYPGDLKDYQKAGAQFIVNPTSNRWISQGTRHFLYLTDNLKKIEAVWLKLPIISSGVKDFAGLFLPDGRTQLVNYESGAKNYGVFGGEIKY